MHNSTVLPRSHAGSDALSSTAISRVQLAEQSSCRKSSEVHILFLKLAGKRQLLCCTAHYSAGPHGERSAAGGSPSHVPHVPMHMELSGLPWEPELTILCT